MMRTLTILCIGLALAGCRTNERGVTVGPESQPAMTDDDGDEDGDDENEVRIGADEIPATVRAAALKAVPGLEIKEAERETQDGKRVYCVHGYVDGEFTEVEVAADGSVLEIESGDDEDDD